MFLKKAYIFNCIHSPLLTSLKGAPKVVEVFNCSNNNIKTLEGGPIEVKDLNCSRNKLNSFKGCPKIKRSLTCIGNNIRSLDDLKDQKDIEWMDIRDNPYNPEKEHWIRP